MKAYHCVKIPLTITTYIVNFLVMVRDDLQLQRLPKHFTLDIKKEGDHNIYEIEGTEERFTNVSELLDYYQKNPLTTEKFTTLGKPCNKPTLGLI